MGSWNFGRGKGTKNKVQHTLTCEWCGISFAATRWDKRTHSPKCRTALSRWERKYRAKFNCRPVNCPRGRPEILKLVGPDPDQ